MANQEAQGHSGTRPGQAALPALEVAVEAEVGKKVPPALSEGVEEPACRPPPERCQGWTLANGSFGSRPPNPRALC